MPVRVTITVNTKASYIIDIRRLEALRPADPQGYYSYVLRFSKGEQDGWRQTKNIFHRRGAGLLKLVVKAIEEVEQEAKP